MNSPDPGLFAAPHRPDEPRAGQGLVLSYHGTLTESNDLTVVLRAMALVQAELPGLVFNIYGRGRAVPGLQALARELGLEERVRFHGYKPLDEIPGLIAHADLGVVPQRRSDFTSMNYPTKAFEYIALGVPVLMTRTPALEEMFGHLEDVFFDCDQPEKLAELIRGLYLDPDRRHALAAAQQAVCERFAWPVESRRYVSVMTRLVQPKDSLPGPLAV